MKIRSLIFATFVLLVLVGALYWSGHHKPAEESTKASADTPPTILKLDEAAVAGLELRNKNAEPIVLTRNSSGAWQIAQPKPLSADQSAVSGVISTLSSLDSERLLVNKLDNKASDLKPYGLDQPAVEIDVTEKDNKTQRLLIGDETPTGSAVYAMLAGDPRIFTMASYLKTSLDKGLDDFRNKKLFDIGFGDPARIEMRSGAKAYFLSKGGPDWWSNGKKMDAASVEDFISKLRDLTASKFVESGFANPAIEITVTSDDGKRGEKASIAKSGSHYIGKRENEPTLYELDSNAIAALQKAVDEIKPSTPGK